MAPRNRVRVRFIVRPNFAGTNAWLALREDFSPEDAGDGAQRRELARRFASIQVWFSDLDDFDTASPAKIIARKAVGAGRLNPSYLRWAFETLFLFCRYGRKDGESKSWKLYYDAFLKADSEHDWLKDEAFRFIDALLTPREIEALLYPAVREFYAGFGAEKYLVTRSLERIAYRYSRVLPYEGYYHEVKDKARVVESFIRSRPEIRRYGSGGDSIEDAELAEMLAFYHAKGWIEEPLCLYRAASPLRLDKAFNVFVGKDRGALSAILAEGRTSVDEGCRAMRQASTPTAP
jgi:hypothetical protein